MKHEIIGYLNGRESDPIVVENFSLYRNKNGNWCYSFDTPNHKYLDHGEGGIDGWRRSLCFETPESVAEVKDGEIHYYAEAGVTIWLTPENEIEEEEIEDIVYCVIHKGWGCYVLLVSQEDFLPPK